MVALHSGSVLVLQKYDHSAVYTSRKFNTAAQGYCKI